MSVTLFTGGSYPMVVAPVLDKAIKSIEGCQYSWKWYARSKRRHVMAIGYAVVGAARRGIDVRILLDLEAPGHPISRMNSKTAQNLSRAGVKVKMGWKGGALHAKFWIVDHRFVVVTSHNLTQRSMTANVEMGVLVDDARVAQEALAYFERLWRER